MELFTQRTSAAETASTGSLGDRASAKSLAALGSRAKTYAATCSIQDQKSCMRKYAAIAKTAWHHKMNCVGTMAIASLRELFTRPRLALIQGRIDCVHLRPTRRCYFVHGRASRQVCRALFEVHSKGRCTGFDLQLKTKAGAYFFIIVF